MRKRTVRDGLRLVMAALILIILGSFFHVQLSDIFALSSAEESRIYGAGMFWASVIGSFGVVMTAFGFALSPQKTDIQVRLRPLLLCLFAVIFLFFYLLYSSIKAPVRDEQRRIRPGETVTI